MNHLIIERENKKASIEKLAAQREIYSQAKVLFIFQTLISVLLFVILSFSQLIFKSIDFTLTIATVSLMVLIVNYGLERRISYLKELAAKVQELFDTYVLQLKWNNILCLDKPEYDVVHKYFQKHKKGKDFSQFANWYEPEIQKVKEDVAKLICQKTNCNYDKDIRVKYNSIIIWIGTIAMSLIVVFAVFSEQTLAKLILTVFFPTIPILQWTYMNINSNKKSIVILEELNSLINLEWNKAKNGEVIENSTLRQIQDGIFLSRKSNPLVPDFIYEKMRDKLEVQTYYSVSQLVDEILNEK